MAASFQQPLLRVLRATWLATTLFAAGTAGALLLLGSGPKQTVTEAVPVLVIAPTFWWLLKRGREEQTHGRGAIAGALIAPAVWIVDVLIAHYSVRLTHPPRFPIDKSWADFGTLLESAVGLIGAWISIPLGSAVGLLSAWAEKVIRRP